MNAIIRAASIVVCLIWLVCLGGCGGGTSSAIVQHQSLLAIVTTAVPNATWLTPYSQTIQTSGGVGPFNWTIASGAPPNGLSLGSSTSDSNTISGTPQTLQQNVMFTIRVTDSTGAITVQAYGISVQSGISISVSPSTGLVRPAKSLQFTATVSGDPKKQGVTWMATQNGPCSPACGTFSSSSTQSGQPTTFVGPATAPANPAVVITATSISDPSTSTGVNINVGIPNPVPYVFQPMSPTFATPGGTSFTLAVNGSGFVSGATINWNSFPLTTNFINGSQLTAQVPAFNIASANTALIAVDNPSLGGGISNPVFFPVAGTIPILTLSRNDVSAGSSPDSIALADFNGSPDLIVASSVTNAVTVLMGNTDGTFQPGIDIPVGTGPSSLVLADVNGDGSSDLVVTNQGSGTVSVLLNNGGGNFQPAVSYTVGTAPVAVVVGDFDGDSIADLAVVNQNCPSGPPCGNGTVSILLGNGDGTFQPHVDYPTADGPTSVAIGDFNADGKLDLAVAAGGGGSGTEVSILLGNGDGTFQAPKNYPLGLNPVAVAAADFNNDGKLDLAVANNGANTISVLLGNGDGTFQKATNYAVGTSPRGNLLVADFNNDGDLDLAIADSGSNRLSVLLGKGDGTFQAESHYATGQKPSAIALTDFNRDGRLDFAVANQIDSTVSILRQTSSLTLSLQALNFDIQLVAPATGTLQETLKNIGQGPVSFTISPPTGTNASDFTENLSGCVSPLAPGNQCTFDVTFSPAVVGPKSASISIGDDSAGSPLTVSLEGIGVVSGPNATLSSNSLNFGDQLIGKPSTQAPLTVTNYGTANVSFTTVTASGPFIETDNCANSTVAPLLNCTLNVVFTPTVKDGVNGTLSINDSAPTSPQNVSLSGAGTFVEFNPTGLSFSCSFANIFRRACICSSPQPTTVTNTDTASLNISAIGIVGVPFTLGSSTCGNSVAPGKSCTVTVNWSPRGLPNGSYEGSLSLTDDGGGSPQRLPLVGNKRCSPF